MRSSEGVILACHWIICTRDPSLGKAWQEDVRKLLADTHLVSFQNELPQGPARESEMIIIDESVLPELIHLDRHGRVVLLGTKDSLTPPRALENEEVDDVLVYPFRALELMSKLRLHELGSSVSGVLDSLQDDFKLVERLQKARIPRRFPKVRGFEVFSRYLSGMRSGGDYFDLAESKDGEKLAILLTDSSSYGLSSTVLSTLMRVTLRLSSQQVEIGSVTDIVQQIHEDVLLTLKEKDLLSLFFGIYDREHRVLKFVNLGSTRVFYAPPGSVFTELLPRGGAIARSKNLSTIQEGELKLDSEGKLVLISEGFLGAVSEEELKVCLGRFREKPAVELLNEFAFRVKSNLSKEELPQRDCTAVVFEVNSQVIKLTKPVQDEN